MVTRCILRYDGLYVSPLQDAESEHAYYRYIRFYEDGKVITVSSTGEPHQVIRWFERDRPATAEGHYEISGDSIRFSSTFPGSFDIRDGTTTEDVRVDYEGAIEGGTLSLKWYSHYNGNKGQEQYRFVQML